MEASYKALAGPVKVQLETVAVLEEVTKHSLSLWLRVHRAGDGALAESADASLLKFLCAGNACDYRLDGWFADASIGRSPAGDSGAGLGNLGDNQRAAGASLFIGAG